MNFKASRIVHHLELSNQSFKLQDLETWTQKHLQAVWYSTTRTE